MSAGGSMLDEAPSEQVTPMERLYDLEERFFVLCERVLNHDAFSNLMGILTVFALFGDDLRLAFCPPDSDESFTIISCIALFAFILEFGLQNYVRPEYRGNFYFWLDLVSTLSLVTDIPFMMEALTNTKDSSDSDSAAALKAGRTSRAGAKAGRVVRIVRLVRMVRIVKLFKLKQQKEADKQAEQEEEEEDFSREPSKVGKKLTELTVQRIIVLLLVMICFFPFLDSPMEIIGSAPLNDFQTYGLRTLHIEGMLASTAGTT